MSLQDVEMNGIVDMETFGQLLEMDDDDGHEFSKSLVDNYREQADSTLHEMEESAQSGDLRILSSLGHFLKGSSAALGLSQVKDTCEQMQHAGQRKLADGKELSEAEALKMCKQLLGKLKVQNAEAEQWLKEFYASDG